MDIDRALLRDKIKYFKSNKGLSWQGVADAITRETGKTTSCSAIQGFARGDTVNHSENWLDNVHAVVKDATKPKGKPVIEVVVPVDLLTQAMNRSVEMRAGA